MDIYQIAAWSSPTYGGGDPAGPPENPPFDPRPEVPSPDIPEETPPFEKEPETPPIQPDPGIPPVEPIVPEVDPIREPGGEPDIPAFN
ncbi:filamentous hemagglutinin [Dyadobacter aurulentus]|uniref:filamentous hemagglutinin n=1 Tax=Dyadobacter sp. UC 10 TaxID=2605428 RepID=UPI0011F22208|nr:filamentous hemagglutinin [Dyadobacter sp. UC 10]KAA0991206.1 filamentous hemagglutinin [Dyadobacter sp. UC 10]